MTELDDRRRAMRLVLRERRASLDDEDHGAASMAVLARLARLPVLRDASLVAGYRAIRGEVDIDAALILLAERGATVTVPRVVGEYLEFIPWAPDTAAASGSFGIPEPTSGDPIPLARHDVVLTPLVAFDSAGRRLGQGGGFYDRAIAGTGEKRPRLIGIAHGFQQVDEVPTEAWDQSLDAVVTEDHVLEFVPGTLDPQR